MVSRYRIPKLVATTIALLGFLVYTTVADSPSIGSQIRAAVGGDRIIKRVWALVVAVHAGEAVYMAGLCKQHKTGLGLGVSPHKFSLSTEANLALFLVTLGAFGSTYRLPLLH